jgi:hypothetical protein
MNITKKNWNKNIDYATGYEFNKTENLKNRKDEVPDGLIGRAMMNDTEAIQNKLRQQINNILKDVKKV